MSTVELLILNVGLLMLTVEVLMLTVQLFVMSVDDCHFELLLAMCLRRINLLYTVMLSCVLT